jgi:hypothetical protein
MLLVSVPLGVVTSTELVVAPVGTVVLMAEVRKGLAQVRICGGVPTGVLGGHALRLSNERFQVVDAHEPLHSSPCP